jgi:quinol monooxygenase YgiN
MALIITAHIHAAPEHRDTVQAELEKLVPPTRKEAGCHTYDLHIDKADNTHFIFYEIWESKTLMDAHMASDHIKAFGAATKGMVADFKLFEMEKLG